MHYVTAQTFDICKVILGDILVKTEPVSFQSIPIKYQYDSGVGPLVIRTHEMFSFGLCETRDQKTDKVVGYSMPFAAYDKKVGEQPEDKRFINMIQSLASEIRNKVGNDEMMSPIRKKRRKKVDVEALSLMKNNVDKPDAPPVMFVKLKTEYNIDPPKIITSFYRKTTQSERNNSENRSIVKVKDPLNYLKKKCIIVGGIAIESVFIDGMIESIIAKLTEVVVVKKLDTQNSIMNDLHFDAYDDSEEEDETEEDSAN